MDFFDWLAIGLALVMFCIGVYDPSRNKPLEQVCLDCGEQVLFRDYSKGGRWSGRHEDGRRIGGPILYAKCRKCGAQFECSSCGLFPDVWSPMRLPIKKRAERVPLASHIIIGVAKSMRVVELKEGQILEVVPEPKQLEKQFVEIEIEVEKVLYPLNWQPETTIRHYYGGGFFAMDSVRRDCIGQRKVYLMKSLNTQMTEAEYISIKNAGSGDVFVQGYGWVLADDIEREFQFTNLVEARIQREAEEAAETTRLS